ncbi:leucine-rich repeat-containing protein 24-like [Phymastichus coffea]|uniref:leucine-rich repeat-containing protein 24-like n=1 Tax=Phymastichus coffea TaxID=108790 RepID=UPI00273CB107|nr:leucine-rich repeat-containing protein 24-like [Phymastichus coffea]
MRPLSLLLTLLCCDAGPLVLANVDKCADVCTCKWKSGKRTVECKPRSLTSVPDGIDPETQVLDASDNDIGALTNNIFVKVRLTNLQKLYLRACKIQRIDEQALAGLTNLVELDLSHNRLGQVPSACFANTPFLRELSLGHNPLQKIQTHAFQETPSLVKLDLSNAELAELASKGFQGLEMLETLTIDHNRIQTLQLGTFEPLKKLRSIELHENPWICDCQLREVKSWLVNQNLPTTISPVCQQPARLANRTFAELSIDDFACPPVMLLASRYAEATIGENASIVCTVTAVPPAKVRWIWNGKLYTNHSTVNNHQKILIYEEGFFRKRNTLVLTNAQETDTSMFFCVAENPAGSVEANFTLHVSLRTAGMSTLGSGQIAGISAALVVLILLILLTIMVLFIRLKRMPQKDVKSAAPNSDNLPLDGCNSTSNPQSAQDPQSATSTISRRKAEELVETTSFAGESTQPPAVAGYALQRTQATNNYHHHHHHHHHHHVPENSLDHYLVNRGYEETTSTMRLQPGVLVAKSSAAAYSSQLIDNPDLIRDTRGGSGDELLLPPPPPPSSATYLQAASAAAAALDVTATYGSRLVDMEPEAGKLLYSECLSWEQQVCRPSVSQQPTTTPTPTPAHQSAAAAAAQLQEFPPGAKQIRVWQKGVPVLPPVSALKRVLGSTRSSPDEGYQEGTGTDV